MAPINAGPNATISSLQGDQLVRTRNAYLSWGFAVLVIDSRIDLAAAVRYMAVIKRPVTVVATSRGTLRVTEGIAHRAKPDGRKSRG